MKYIVRHLGALAVLLTLTACATGPGESRIELDQVVRDVPGASPRWQPAEPAQAGLRVWRGMQEVAATRGMRLQPGDVLQTGAASAAVIRYSGGAPGAGTGSVALDENTRVRVGSLEVFFGRIFANVRGLFETTSENIVAGVEGTRFAFEIAAGSRDVRVVVASGVVVCTSRDGSWQPLRLHANQALISKYPSRSPPRVVPADARELRDLEDWAAKVSAVPPPPPLPTPYFQFGVGVDRGRGGGSNDGGQKPEKARDPAGHGQ